MYNYYINMTIEERIEFLMSKAKFELSKEDLSKFTKDLNIFVENVKVLDTFDLENVKPIRQPFEKSENLLRDDEVVNNNHWNFIENAPSSKDGYILLSNSKKGNK